MSAAASSVPASPDPRGTWSLRKFAREHGREKRPKLPRAVRRLERWLGARPRVRHLTAANLSGLADWLVRTGRTPGDAKGTVRELNRLAERAVDLGILPKAPLPPNKKPWKARGNKADASAPPDLSPSMTLEQFFEAYVLPLCLTEAATGTLEAYRGSLRLWRRLMGRVSLSSINEFLCAQFRQKLGKLKTRGGEPLSPNTIRKHCVHVQAVIDRAGPPTRQCRVGAKLIPTAPLIPKPAVRIAEVDDNFTLEEISYWLEACGHAYRPAIAGVAPADWWRAAILFAYNTGVRLQTLLAARYDWLTTDELGTWIVAPPEAMKQQRGRRLFLNHRAVAAVEAIRTPRELIFPWPHWLSYLHQCRREMLLQSPIARPRQFGFHGLRKALATELGKVNGMAAKMALGHAGGDVTINHYTHRVVMVEALQRLPQPSFAWPAADGDAGRIVA